MNETYFYAVAAALCFMVLDVVSGFAAAAKNGEISSTRMREGLYHKASLVLVIACAGAIEFFMGHVPSLGFSAPLLVPACVLIVAMEVVSVLENATKLNPELANSKLLQLFSSSKE